MAGRNGSRPDRPHFANTLVDPLIPRLVKARRTARSRPSEVTASGNAEVGHPRLGQLMWIPEIARLMTSRWTSDVPSKMV
jgi:hypothetical protein